MQCEKDETADLILRKAFPEAQHDNDIFELTKEKIENDYGIKNLEDCTFIGGLCCQPFSVAGPAKGRNKDTWMCDELLRLTRDCRPRFVVSENVVGFIEHEDGLPYLIPQMEKIGYIGQSLCLPASAFAAPHERQRVFTLFTRDCLVSNSSSVRWNAGTISNNISLKTIIPGFYNRRCVSKSGISSLAYGRATRAEINYLRICGNGVEHETGSFIAKIIKAINDFFYESPIGKQIVKIPHKSC